METPNSFGEWLRRRRRALDWTQEELARQAGCATRTIRKIEADELRPSKQLAEILAQCLDIPPKDREDFVRFARGVLRDVIPPMPFVEETAHFAQTGSAAKLIHNLPAQLSSFVGREREIADVKRLLVQSRLVTLTGAGGCGKTRLALQVARDLTGLRAGDLSGPDFPDGVWFVDLAPLSDPVLVPQVIASVFGLHQVSDTPINVLLQNFFRAKNLLLVLDNCEQLIQACAQLCVGLLGACPTLKILATSRETLNIAGETAFRVPSLSIPDLQKPQSINALQQSESIRLFVERARGARSDFQLHDANARAVAQVCQRLDGIPLAIELAAARVNAFSIEEIATHLDNRFCLLTSGSRTALPRYQTLRASVDWSYDLLSDAERVLFRHLGIFVGGFTLDAVEAVCAEENQSEVLDLLSQLVSKSLVISEQRGTSRYRLLETIRDYALAKLGDVGETDLFRARHLDYFLKLAEEIAPHLREPGAGAWLDVLEIEHDNVRAAFWWAKGSGREEIVLRLTWALYGLWLAHGYFDDARDCFAVALALPSANEPRLAHLRAKVLLGAARIAQVQSDYAAANPLAHECLALFKKLGEHEGIADALTQVGLIAWEQGNYASAHASLQETLAIRKRIGNQVGIAIALMHVGIAERELGNYAEGRRLIEQALEMHREWGFEQLIGIALMHLGATVDAQGDPGALSILEEGVMIFQRLGDKHGLGRCLHDLGKAAARQGNYELAHGRFEESALLLRELGDRRNLVKCVEGLAGIAVTHEQMERAARLFGASEAAREKLGTPLPASYRPNYEHAIAALAAEVDEQQMEKWWNEGRAMTMEQAIEYALAE